MRSCFPSSSSSSRKNQSDLSYSTRQNNKAREAGSIGQAGRGQATALCVCGPLDLLQPPRALSDAQHRDKGKISFQSILSQHVWSTQDSFFKQSLLYLIHYKIWKNCRKAADWNWRSLARNSSGPSAKWSTISIKTRKGHSWEADKKVPLLYKPQFKCPVSVCLMPCAPVVLGFPPGPYLMKHDTSTCKETPAEVFCFVCLKRKKKRKGRKIKEKRNNGWLLAIGSTRRLCPPCHGLFTGQRPQRPRARVAIAAPTVALSLSLCISYLLTYIYIYIYIFFLHLQDIMIPIVPIWIQVWFLEHRNVFYSVVAAELGLLSQLHTNVPFRILLGCVCVFFLHKKYVCLVQWLLFYPDDWGYAGYPPQLPAEDVFTELGRVHSSPTGAHNFKSSLLQPLEDLWRQQDRNLLRGKATASAT